MQRPRSACQYVNQQEWDMDEDEFIMARRYNVLERFSEYETRGDQGMVREMRGEGRCGAPMTCTDMIWSPFLDSLDKVQQCNINYSIGLAKKAPNT